MTHFPSFKELDAVGEAYAVNYLKSSLIFGATSFDIDGFARHLGYNVIYEDFAEDDRSKNGFCADGVTPLHVVKDGQPTSIVFPRHTIVLEKYLLRFGEEKRRRFALAHEIGHPLLDKLTGIQSASCFHTEYDMDQTLSPESMQRMFSMNEVCTSRLGAAILMPRFMVIETLKKHNNGKVKSKASNNRKPTREFVGPSTVREIHKILRNAFEKAIKWEMMGKNPAINATTPKETPKEREIWDVETFHKALEVCDDDFLALAMNLAFSCTLRMGEMLGITLDCVDVSDTSIAAGRASIYINKGLQRVNIDALEKVRLLKCRRLMPPKHSLLPMLQAHQNYKRL